MAGIDTTKVMNASSKSSIYMHMKLGGEATLDPYLVYKISDPGTILVAAHGDIPGGVVQAKTADVFDKYNLAEGSTTKNPPPWKVNEEVKCCVFGVSFFRTGTANGDAVEAGNSLSITDTEGCSGMVKPAANGEHIVGFALDDGAKNSVFLGFVMRNLYIAAPAA